MNPLSVRLPTRTRLKLRAVARLRGLSEGAVVREALRPHLEHELRELGPENERPPDGEPGAVSRAEKEREGAGAG